MAPSESEALDTQIAQLDLDDAGLVHLRDLIDEAAPLHEDCSDCQRLRRAIVNYEARSGRQLAIPPRNGA